MKTLARKKCRKMFFEAIFFAFEKTFFRVSVSGFKFLVLRCLLTTSKKLNSKNHERRTICNWIVFLIVREREFLVIDGAKMNKAKFFKNLVFTSKPEIN